MDILLADWRQERALKLAGGLSPTLGPVKVIHDLNDLVSTCKSNPPDVILSCLAWPKIQSENSPLCLRSGLDVLARLKSQGSPSEVIVFEDGARRLSIEEYCRPFLGGACYFLDSEERTFVEDLNQKVHECLLSSVGRRRKWQQQESVRGLFYQFGIIGESAIMMNIFDQIQKAAQLSDVPVLISGESGTGKQMIAEAIHKLDEKRASNRFVTLNCSTISSELAESQLFGHRRGSFTGAVIDRVGYFRTAHRGTLLLDEIIDLPMSVQPKLLRALQENKVLPLGEDIEMPVDVRVIATSNRDLRTLVADGRFRIDLYQRLNVFTINVPPLRSHPEDLFPLVSYFIRKHAKFYSRQIDGVDPRVLEILMVLELEGNVRELENLVKQILCAKESGGVIELRDLPGRLLQRAMANSSGEGEQQLSTHLIQKVIHEGMSLPQAVEYCEKLLLGTALSNAQGNRSRAAKLLKTTPRTIFNKLQKYRKQPPFDAARSVETKTTLSSRENPFTPSRKTFSPRP